jgi:hypothetical protein
MKHDLKAISKAFDMRADFVSAEPFGSGHINDTYAAWYNQGGRPIRYIHQRINHEIFKDPVMLMQNIERVTQHLRDKLVSAGAPDVTRRTLTLIPALDGKNWHTDPDGNTWRTYIFIDKAQTYDQIETHEQAFQAAKAFGHFQELLSDMSGPMLVETIPDFHNTRNRFDVLKAAVEADTANRAKQAEADITFALEREEMVDVLLNLQAKGRIPTLITHNDTKLNNVMLDDETTEGICVIDLDTVMPGLSLYDFGDMVRTAARSSAEDEKDLSKVEARLDMFEAITRGYLDSAGDMLTQTEKDHLAFSARLITFEIGIRFLTDYLQGDVYFKTHREGHNLDRCRVQFKMVELFEQQEARMDEIVRQAGGAK